MHSLLSFRRRANRIRRDFPSIKIGIAKCRDAIENSLSKAKGFSFDDMKGVITEIVEKERSEAEARELQNLLKMGTFSHRIGKSAKNESRDFSGNQKQHRRQASSGDSGSTSEDEASDGGGEGGGGNDEDVFAHDDTEIGDIPEIQGMILKEEEEREPPTLDVPARVARDSVPKSTNSSHAPHEVNPTSSGRSRNIEMFSTGTIALFCIPAREGQTSEEARQGGG